MLWDKIMKECPFMKDIIEKKIDDELSKRDEEINRLKKIKTTEKEKVTNLENALLEGEGVI